MAWFRKDKKPLKAEDRREVATEVFDKCQGCGDILYRERLAQNLNVCPNCGYHLRIGAQAYVGILLDEGSFTEFDENLKATDPLGFVDLKDYPTRIAAAEANGKNEALISGAGTLNGIDVTIAVMDFDFIGRRSQLSPTFGARGSVAASTTATPYSSRNGEYWYQRNRRGLGSIGRATTSTLPSTYAPRPHSRDYYRGHDDYWRW